MSDLTSQNNVDKQERHQRRMERKKQVVDEAIASAQEERGVILVNTGNGKGKSSAAFGVVARALGHGMRVAVIQFVKGRSDTGEESFFKTAAQLFPDRLVWHVTGEGFTWEIQNMDQDIARAKAAWAIAEGYLHDPEYDLVVLDEMTYAFKFKWLEIEDVLSVFRSRPPMQHVIVTGRAAPTALMEMADTVTEMQPVKHAFKAGVKAMPGMEW